MSERFAYDEVPYDTEPNPEAHPRAMASIAQLFGIACAPPSSCRVLEIGCGNGEHLLTAAAYLPKAQFVGFDLAARAIEDGKAAAHASGVGNVELVARDVRDVRRDGMGAPFDYVIAHGLYSWVPEDVRADLLAVMRSSLARSGVGFVSVNALPGWELRRALRLLAMHAAERAPDPAAKVAAALAVIDEIAGLEGEGFAGILAEHARVYREHVARATPEAAPFSRYVFHDLLADCNEPFSVADLAARLGAAGLRVLAETPLASARADGFAALPRLPSVGTVPEQLAGLAAYMATSGVPFLQVLVCRDDAGAQASEDPEAASAMHLWADFAPAGTGVYRTTTGATFRPRPGSAVERAARVAPGFVPVRELEPDPARLAGTARELFGATCHGVLSVVSEPPPTVAKLSSAPAVAAFVRHRAADAALRGAASAVLTSALHRSFHVPWVELVVVRELDGATELGEVRARVAQALATGPEGLLPSALRSATEGAVAEHVDTVLERLARYHFLVA